MRNKNKENKTTCCICGKRTDGKIVLLSNFYIICEKRYNMCLPCQIRIKKIIDALCINNQEDEDDSNNTND